MEQDGSQEDETVFISPFWDNSSRRRFISNGATMARVFSFRKWTPWHCHVTRVRHLATPETKLPILLVQLYDSIINFDCKFFSLAPPMLSSAISGSISAPPCAILFNTPTRTTYAISFLSIWIDSSELFEPVVIQKAPLYLVLWLQVVTQIRIFGYIDVIQLDMKLYLPKKGQQHTFPNEFRNSLFLELHQFPS